MKKNTFTIILLFISTLILSNNIYAQEEDAGRSGKVEPQYMKEIDQLAKNKQIQVAFQSILAQNKRNREELIMLTEIPAPPFMEDADKGPCPAVE